MNIKEMFICEGCSELIDLEYYGADSEGITLCPSCLEICDTIDKEEDVI